MIVSTRRYQKNSVVWEKDTVLYINNLPTIIEKSEDLLTRVEEMFQLW